jgi:hypothetical protein
MRATEDFHAYGHPNVTARHAMTFEITKDSNLTKRGDCVIAVRATKGLADLSIDLRNLCEKDGSRITVELRAAGFVEFIEGTGSSRLTLSHLSEIVGRKSQYISDRTLMIRADKAARDINRALVDALKFPHTRIRIRITAEV